MAPPHFLPNQPLRPHHRSKAQTCLFKILHIISVFPADHSQCLSTDDKIHENKGFDVDLNISLRPPTEIEPPVTADDGSDGENCNDRRKSESYDVEPSELPVEEERATEDSEICHVGDQSSGIDYDGYSISIDENQREEGCLGLLIEAAQLILEENESTPHKNSPRKNYVESSAAVAVAVAVGGGTKRKQQCWTPELEGTTPVLKSKRGRNVVFPGKYRDSIVEPLVGWTPSPSPSPAAYRSNSNTDRLPSKRRTK